MAAASTTTNTTQLFACGQHRAQTNRETIIKEFEDQNNEDDEEPERIATGRKEKEEEDEKSHKKS